MRSVCASRRRTVADEACVMPEGELHDYKRVLHKEENCVYGSVRMLRRKTVCVEACVTSQGELFCM